jgi:16S rRNA (guanine1207-N2)-methyltransferase
MSHYFINDEKLNHDYKNYTIKIKDTTLRFITDAGVFSKEGLDFGSRVLLENIELDQSHKTVIDMGCGYGPIGIYVAKTYPDKKVYLYDVNDRAIDLAKQNSEINQLKNVHIEQSFLFDQVNIEPDVILTNPPIRAGKQTIFKLYEQAHETLKNGGILYVVIQKKQGAPSTEAKLATLFSQVEVKVKYKGYWLLLAQK